MGMAQSPRLVPAWLGRWSDCAARGFFQHGLGSGICKDTLNLRCNSVELLLSLLALGQGPQRRTKSLPVGRSAWEAKGISDAGSCTGDSFGGNMGAMKMLFSLSRPQAHPAYKFAESNLHTKKIPRKRLVLYCADAPRGAWEPWSLTRDPKASIMLRNNITHNGYFLKSRTVA